MPHLLRCLPALMLFAGCASDDYTQLYASQPLAPSLNQEDVEALEHMGAQIIDQGVNFAIYSERAERIELLLFDDPESDLPNMRFPMTRCGDVWSVYVEGVGKGQHYGFVAWGPNWPYQEDFVPGSEAGFIRDVDEDGNRFNPNKLLFDPWGLAIHRDHDWGRASLGTGEGRRYESTWGAAAKSIVWESDYTWSESEEDWIAAKEAGEGYDWNEIILYEVHPKGFTANGMEGIDHPGTYRGIGENAPYLAELGITAIELLPIHEKPLDGGYWGYNNISFFAPELSYSAAFNQSGEPLGVLDEFKWMVDQLHQNGIEVIIDVVYNHTGEGGLWRDKLYYEDWTADGEAVEQAVKMDSLEAVGLYSFRGFDNAAWYALSEDGLSYWNNTGVGNQTRPNHTPTRRLIMDSLYFMVEELHVDGFRFDLAGILGEEDLNYNTWDDPHDTVIGDIMEDPFLQSRSVRLYAEPWTATAYSNLDTWSPISKFPASETLEGYGWGEWNARFRDWWRSFINEGWTLQDQEGGLDGGATLTGSYNLYGWNGRRPYHATNFITVHDGFTMYDLLSYSEKQNGCGVLNPVCCEDGGTSVWCDQDTGESHNRSRDWGVDNEAFKRQLMRNFFVAMLSAHGTPLLLGGDEWMRTQYGNNNAYTTQSDNEWNWFRWGEWMAYDDRHRMKDFVAEMNRFRLDHLYALGPLNWGEHMPMAWKSARNDDGVEWDKRHLMVHYYDDGEGDWGPELLLLINMEDSTVDFTLPEERSWARVVDTQAWFDQGDLTGESGWFEDNPNADTRKSANILRDSPESVDGGSYGVPPYTIVILEQQD